MPSGLGAREAKRLLSNLKQQQKPGERKYFLLCFTPLYLPGGGSEDDMESVSQQLSGMGIQEVGREVGTSPENLTEARSRVGSKMSQVADRRSVGGKSSRMVGMEEEKSKSNAKEEEDEEPKVDNTGHGAEATRGIVEGANMENKQ